MLGCLFKHKWVYDVEDIIYSRLTNYVHSSGDNDRISVPTNIRLCQRCYKKQRAKGVSVGDWIECELTIQEERDKKLKEIGI